MKDAEHRSLRKAEDEHWFYRGKREICLHWLKKLPMPISPGEKWPRILDVGSGSGKLLSELKTRFSIAGIEYAAEALDNPREEVAGSLARASALSLPFPDRSMAVVTCMDVVEHIEDDRSAVGEIFRVLQPGGWGLFNVPAFQWLWSDWDEIHGHFRRYNRRQFQEVLAASSFRIHQCAYENFIGVFPAMTVRTLRRFMGKDSLQVENQIPPPLMNHLLRWGYVWPAMGLSRCLPCGLSVFAVVQKPD